MNALDLYYFARPFIPRNLQIGLRRVITRRRRRQVADTWPILEEAGRPPERWCGWPDGKQFAFILTHDVETSAGHDKCRRIMDLEESMGFRSVFNFVPERYHVSEDLRLEMTQRGFEVGVHGLNHDGRLFRSRGIFKDRVKKINHYLESWRATGFRSPSMRHNLRWMRQLDITYDSSTFDTDPFEPEPEGAGTVFPYGVRQQDGNIAFVELPYTLPQDFTLFVLMQETTPDIWMHKLDWLASKGGMALLNVHPDYVSAGSPSTTEDYPIAIYEAFLGYVRTQYEGRYWHVLPRQAAAFCAERPERVGVKSLRRICMLAYAFYDTDNRILRYSQTLVRRGDDVVAIGLRGPGQKERQMVDGVTVYRIQARKRDERTQYTYLARMIRFWLKSFFLLSRLHLQHAFQLIHVHSLPDFEVFAAWIPKRLGAKVILDIHDLVPEFYVSKFGEGNGSRVYRILVCIERLSARFADHVIAANHIWQQTLISRSTGPGRCTAIPNYVDTSLFKPHKRMRTDGDFRILYPGGLQWHQGVDVIVRAIQQLRDTAPHVQFYIYGDGSERDRLKELIGELDLKECVHLKETVPIQEIPQIMADADLGIVAKRNDFFGNEAYSTKILEFMSQGVPVIVSRTEVDTHYFNDEVVRFFEPGNDKKLAEAVLTLMQDDDARRELKTRAFAFAAKNSWALREHVYSALVDSLIGEAQEV